jgi:hypothetical protein
MEYVSPFDERVREQVAHAPRLDALSGRTVALLDINKARGAEFLDRLEELLLEQGARTTRAAKPAFSRPATQEQLADLADRADAVVEALAD